jgi:hypothetical protein
VNTKSISALVWIAPAAVLVVATAPLPYGYYTFTRIVVCLTGLVIAGIDLKNRRQIGTCSAALTLIAILFNPVVPIHLTRTIWFYLDLVAAAVFIAHLAVLRTPLTSSGRWEATSK